VKRYGNILSMYPGPPPTQRVSQSHLMTKKVNLDLLVMIKLVLEIHNNNTRYL